MSVIVETRNKRILSKGVKITSDKIKTSCGKGSTIINDSNIEFDCAFKIKECKYNPEKEYADIVKKENTSFLNIIEKRYVNLSVNDTMKKIQSGSCCTIDVRDCRTYQNGHIKGALLFNCQKRMMMLKAKKSWEMFDEKVYFDSIVIYNQKGEDSSLLQDFIDYIKKDSKVVFFIDGGYEEFFKYAKKELIESEIPEEIFDQHHYSLTNESTKSTDVLNASISEILPYLYLGNEIDSKDLELLKRKKITHILNVTNSVPFFHEGQFIYKRLSATDCNKQNMRVHYDEAFNFIAKAKSDGGKVLVHCWAGVSRSATIVAAYLLKHSTLNVLQAISFLRSKRPVVEPNFNFLGQLERFYCDLENNVESRTLINGVHEIFENAAELEREKDVSVSSESPSSPLSPLCSKPYFNMKK